MHHPDDKINAGLNVDAVYTFSAMLVAHVSLENAANGYFKGGGLFFTAQSNER